MCPTALGTDRTLCDITRRDIMYWRLCYQRACQLIPEGHIGKPDRMAAAPRNLSQQRLNDFHGIAALALRQALT
jgi:hypothetical protein